MRSASSRISAQPERGRSSSYATTGKLDCRVHSSRSPGGSESTRATRWKGTPLISKRPRAAWPHGLGAPLRSNTIRSPGMRRASERPTQSAIALESGLRAIMAVMNDDALAYLAIMRLQRAYADLATRRAWPEVASLATSDAGFSFDIRSGKVIEVIGAQAFGEFGARSTERFSFYEYVPLNTVVKIGAGIARGRAYSLEVGEDRDTREWINFYGLYHDDYVLFDGAWLFARRHYQTLGRRTGDRMAAFPLEDRPL